jgi:hypothetical protein
MKTDFDYTNDLRWLPCSEIHKKFGVSPNWFVNVLLTFVDKTRLERYKIAIETGTFEAYTTECFAELFDEVHTSEKYVTGNSYTSINLLEKYKLLKNKHNHVNFYTGDSTDFLKYILPIISQPYVILLDAHNANSSPIKEELIIIKENTKVKDIILIIDDCADVGTGTWPNQQELEKLILDINPNFKIKYTQLGRNILIAYE